VAVAPSPVRSSWELTTVVAETTARCTPAIWGFGVGGSLCGLVRAGRALNRPDLVQRVVELVEPSLRAAPGPTDHLIAVDALLALASCRPDVDVGMACDRWLRAVLDASRPVPGRPRVHRPDLTSWQSTIWVDCMHTDGPGLAALGRPEEAVTYAMEYAGVLQRTDGLFQHGYDVETGRGNGVAWGRGQAWAMLGLVDTLHRVGDDELTGRLARLVEALCEHEVDGQWRTVVDDEDAPSEPSVAAYVAYGLGRAIAYGLVDAGHQSMADRALDATIRRLSGGWLPVSEATPVGAARDYRDRALGAFPWGQAPVLHVLLDRMAPKESP
jgi:rhamnogalacturonyl hydrolase YesR